MTMTGSSSSSPASSSKIAAPEFVAVILAATTGARLFPLTSSKAMPKHLLPVGGIPLVERLLLSVAASGFTQCVVILAPDDTVTIPLLSKQQTQTPLKSRMEQVSPLVYKFQSTLQVTFHVLSNDCAGSAKALQSLEETRSIPESCHLVIVPGDLVVMDTTVLQQLVDAHRQCNLPPCTTHTAITLALTHVGEQDEHGIPLKESAKAKKGGLAREEEDIEYIALTPEHRVVWKQSKIDVEEDEDRVGQTPKLVLPKPRLCGGVVTIQTDWSDVHAYVLSPWVRKCYMARSNLFSVQGDVLPLLVSRQFRGVAATFGSSAADEGDNHGASLLEQVLSSPPFGRTNSISNSNGGDEDDSDHHGPTLVSNQEYAVRAHVLDGWKALRACTIPSYLYACREVVSRAVDDKANPCLSLPLNTTVHAKFHSIVLEDAIMGEKVTCKSSSVGRRSKLSAKCRLNNVVVMDDVTIGENCVLQNSILGAGCTIGENSNLNDCQVAPGKIVSPGTKEKGESIMDAL